MKLAIIVLGLVSATLYGCSGSSGETSNDGSSGGSSGASSGGTKKGHEPAGTKDTTTTCTEDFLCAGGACHCTGTQNKDKSCCNPDDSSCSSDSKNCSSYCENCTGNGDKPSPDKPSGENKCGGKGTSCFSDFDCCSQDCDVIAESCK